MTTQAERIKDEAAEWLIRRESAPQDATLRAELETWLDADPRHRAAFIRLEAAWRRADVLKRIRPYDGPVDIDLLAPPDAPTPAAPAPRQRRLHSWGVLAAALALAASVLIAWQTFARPGWQTYETEVGGMSRVVLKDGTRVNLNTNTEMAVRLTADKRRVELVRGEAQFDVASDRRRPFDVRAHTTTVRAVGTSFTVRLRDEDRVEVFVTEGKVEIDPEVSTGSAAVEHAPTMPVLSAGEVATVQSTGMQIDRVQEKDVSRRLAWVDGWIDFDGESLADAVEEFNRYNRKRIVIANPQIATFSVGGRFRATDPESFVASIGKSHGVNAISENGEVIELR